MILNLRNFSVVQSQTLTIVMAIVMMVGVRWLFNSGEVIPIDADRGIVVTSANLWISSEYASMVVNVALTLTAGVLMLLINQRYNLLGTVSTLEATMFFAMSMAMPDLLAQLFTGTPLPDRKTGR